MKTSTATGRSARLVERSAVLLAAVLLVLGLAPAAPAAAEQATPVTYQGAVYPAGVNPPSADKPQSKLWYQDGSWWALMLSGNTSTITIFELRGTTWVDTGTQIDNRPTSTADALWDGGRLYVASRTSSGSLKVSRFSYAASTRTYRIDSGFPVTAAGGGSETVTIARDTTGRLWITYTQSSAVWVAHSTTSESAWAAPFRLPGTEASVSSDDISAVLSFGTSTGVMVSDQADGAIRFAVHQDGAPVTSWTWETALSGPSMADDHINLKSITGDAQGRVYAAVKTSRNLSGGGTDPIIVVLKRTGPAAWTSSVAGQVRDELTRAQIALDTSVPSRPVLHVLATAPESGGIVYAKRAPVDDLRFPEGRGEPFITWPGATINNVSLGKDPVTSATGLVAIATDGGARRYYTGVLALAPPAPAGDAVAPTVPADVVASAPDSTRVQVSWSASTDAVGVTGYSVLRGGVQVGTSTTTSFSDTSVVAGATYSYTVRARDAAGNVSAASAPATVAVPAAPAPAGDTVAPTVPADVVASAPDSTRVQVSWSASTDAVGVTGYSVLRGGVQVGTSTTTSFSDTSVVAGATYSYTVRAGDAAGNVSAASAPATVAVPAAPAPAGDTVAPTVPADVVASAPDSTRVQVSWSASTDAVGVTGYSVLRGGVQVGTSTTTSFSDTSVVAGATYSYTVRARDAAGNVSAASAPATVAVPAAPAPAEGPAFRDSSTATASSATSLDLATPTAVAAGDLLVAVISARGTRVPAAAAGWTRLRSDELGTTMTQSVFTRTATSAEPASSTWQFTSAVSGVAGQVLAYSGVASVAAHAASLNATSSATVTAPAVPTAAGQLVVVAMGIARTATLPAPSGLAGRTLVTATGKGKLTAVGADAPVVATGTGGPYTSTASGSAASIGHTLVLHPRA